MDSASSLKYIWTWPGEEAFAVVAFIKFWGRSYNRPSKRMRSGERGLTLRQPTNWRQTRADLLILGRLLQNYYLHLFIFQLWQGYVYMYWY